MKDLLSSGGSVAFPKGSAFIRENYSSKDRLYEVTATAYGALQRVNRAVLFPQIECIVWNWAITISYSLRVKCPLAHSEFLECHACNTAFKLRQSFISTVQMLCKYAVYPDSSFWYEHRGCNVLTFFKVCLDSFFYLFFVQEELWA